MKRIVVTIVFMMLFLNVESICFGYTDTYPHRSVCPNPTGAYLPGDFFSTDIPCWVDGGSQFCQCQCTAYAAWKIQEQGLAFNNSFDGVRWSNGGLWDTAAVGADIGVDGTPFPGDIAYWDNKSRFGHVAFVERVYFNADGNPSNVDISQYNVIREDWSEENIPVDDPDGYIHILLYKFGVMFYVDSLEMSAGGTWDATPFSNQTSEEGRLLLKKLANYRDVNINEEQAQRALVYFGAGGKGGGDDKRKPLPNLQLKKLETFDKQDRLLTPEKSFLESGKTYQLHLWPVSKKENCRNGIEKGKNTVESDTFSKISLDENQGEWRFLGRSYTKCVNLTKDNSKKEVLSFTIPLEAKGKRIYLKSKADSTDEVTETDEHDNWSDKVWFPVNGNCDLTVSYARLTRGRTVLQEGESFGVEMAVLNNGPDFCPMDIRSVYLHRKPTSSVWETLTSDGTKAVHLAPGKEHPELTKDEPFIADIVGFHDIMVCVDNLEAQPETNEGNNCFQFSFEVTEKKETILPDYTVLNAALTGNRTLLSLGDHFGIWMTVANIGNAPAPKDSIGGYYVMYPNTENWVYLADDTTNKDQLCVNCSHLEITQDDPFKADQFGIWKALACSSYKYEEKELEYANNCKEIRFEVTAGQVKLPDYITADASLTRGKTSLKLGDHFSIRGVAKNIGNANSQEDTRIGYYLMRPGGGEYKIQDSDKVTKKQMCVNCSQEEWTKDEPFIADAVGRWQGLVCASYEYKAKEINYENNCFPWFSFDVKPDYGFRGHTLELYPG